jgi:PLD-like domain
VRRLRERLGTDTSAADFVKVCRLSCRGGRGNQHAKFVTVSSGTSGDHLVMVGSLNLTNYSSQRQWNDLYVASDRGAHDQLVDVFERMADDRPQARLAVRVTAKGFETDLAPYTTGSGGDPIKRRLDRVRCRGTSLLSGNGERRTVVRVAMHAWNGDRGIDLARRVARLHRRGCDVKVLYGKGMGRAVATTLRDSGVPLRDSNNGGRRVHHKVMILSGVLGRQTDANYVWTGSHNWSDRSLRNDEIMFRVSGRHLVQDYLANFRRMWRAAR